MNSLKVCQTPAEYTEHTDHPWFVVGHFGAGTEPGSVYYVLNSGPDVDSYSDGKRHIYYYCSVASIVFWFLAR